MSYRPKIVGIGGVMRAGSTSELALKIFLHGLAERGAETRAFLASDLNFPLFDPYTAVTDPQALTFTEAVKTCDAFVMSTPVYHAGPSGLLKNAIDYLSPLVDDERPYLTGRVVTCIAAAGGHPGAMTALAAMRDMVHSLRGWPTPMHIPVNSSAKPFNPEGTISDPKLEKTFVAAQNDMWTFLARGARL